MSLKSYIGSPKKKTTEAERGFTEWLTYQSSNIVKTQPKASPSWF